MPSTKESHRSTLLIVDDDPEVVRALAFMAEARGYRVSGCRTATEALATVESRHACLIIDQTLPDLRGIDLLTVLRDRGIDCPAVIITTAPSSALRRQAEAAGAPIVEKPLLDEALFTQIGWLLRRHSPE